MKFLKNKKLIIVLFILYLLVLIKFLFLKIPLDVVLDRFNGSGGNIWYSINYVPFRTINVYLQGLPTLGIAVSNLVGNIFLFFPFGFLVPLLKVNIKTYKQIFFVSFLFSFFIEIIQVISTLGSFDVDDIILNTFGSILGFILFRQASKSKKFGTSRKLI